jgi:serine phosphatase RsbU (regulator of sigma subunit)
MGGGRAAAPAAATAAAPAGPPAVVAAPYAPPPYPPAPYAPPVGPAGDGVPAGDADRLARELGRELQIGREIQAGFLPAELPRSPGWEVAAAFEPARQVSGDFYDAFEMADGMRIGLVVGDVCGKGVGASLFMALFRSLIRAVATRKVRSGHTLVGDPDSQLFGGLTLANDYIADVHGAANMFATVFAAAVDPLTGRVRWVNAGHEPGLVLAAGGGVRERLAPSGPALGLFPGATHTAGSVTLAPGETLLVTTDGVSEARDRAGAFFGDARLEALCAAPAGGAAALAARVTDAVHAFAAGAEPADDVTLVAVHRAADAPVFKVRF